MTLPGRFDDAARAAVLRVMELRRDVREFRDGEVTDETLGALLRAAALAPSVGFSQPWAFVVVRDRARRERIRESFLRCREAESARFPEPRRERYLSYRLEGIQESSLNLCVLADLRPREGVILGTTAQPEAVRSSVCCAVQNLWLAARAEGLGVGWVSIVEPAVLREELALPEGVHPVAYLCIGHPKEHRERPLLEETGWRSRRDPTTVTHQEQFSSEEGARTERVPSRADAREASKIRQSELTKPVGSLGRLEEVSAWYARAHGEYPPPAPRVHLTVFAADHGVVVEGVSAYSSSVTAAMVENVMAGGAAVSCLARRLDVSLSIVDVGVTSEISLAPSEVVVPLVSDRVRDGTRNLRVEPAMTAAEVEAALDVGRRAARRAVDAGNTLLGAGEIGIGNTTAAAALVCAFTGAAPEDIVGTGTGITDVVRARKVAVVKDALARTRGAADPVQVLASFGGLELSAIAGYLLESATLSVPVVLDGFLASAAALAAQAISPEVSSFLLLSHASAEKGATVSANALRLAPLLDFGMRLGEGTGAVLAADLVRTAVRLEAEMATFASARVASSHPSGRADPLSEYGVRTPT